MTREIILSKRSSKKLEELLEYLELEWSQKVKIEFIEKLDKSLDHIQKYPNSFPQTNFVTGLHKCVVTKQISLYYRFDKKSVKIVTVFDNRQDPTSLKKETG